MLLIKIIKLYEWNLIISANVLSSLYIWGLQFQHFFDQLASYQPKIHTYSLLFSTMCFVLIFFTLYNYNYMVATWCFVLIILILLNWNHSVVPIQWFFWCVFGVVIYPPLFWILFQFLWSIGLTFPNFHRFIYLHPSPPIKGLHKVPEFLFISYYPQKFVDF